MGGTQKGKERHQGVVDLVAVACGWCVRVTHLADLLLGELERSTAFILSPL